MKTKIKVKSSWKEIADKDKSVWKPLKGMGDKLSKGKGYEGDLNRLRSRMRAHKNI